MLASVPPHPVPTGPLAVRWLAHEIPPPRAGSTAVARIELENAGSATWRARGGVGIHLSYHWLDPLGNPIIWAGLFTPMPRPIPPGERLSLELPIAAPMPPGRYRLAVDLVDEGRFWFAELGNEWLDLELDVKPRLDGRALAVRIEEGPAELVEATKAALATQEEPVSEDGEATAFLAAGCRPAPDWSSRILDAHAEGFAAVAGSIVVEGGWLERRRTADALGPWQPGFGRSPSWALPLLCPSLVADVVDTAPWAEPVEGLPALDAQRLAEPWLCDGRIRVEVAAKALRPSGRRSG